MNLKDENSKIATRFGFRFQPAKSSKGRKQDEDAFGKNGCHGDNASIKSVVNKFLDKQQTLAVREVSSSRKKKVNVNEQCSDKNSAASNESNSSLKSKSTSSIVGNIRKMPCIVKQAASCSTGHSLQINDPLRRSRSRDACREPRCRKGIGEGTNIRDQSLGTVKGRSKSREWGLKSSDIKNPLRVSNRSGAHEKTSQGRCPTPSAEVRRKSKNFPADIACRLKDSENNSIDQASLRADLNFLRRKLVELKGVLSGSLAIESDISSITEENCLLREENSQLKEKVERLEEELELKVKELAEMNEKFAAMNYSSNSIEEDVREPHDPSLIISNQNHSKKHAQNKNFRDASARDLNENISCLDDSILDNHLLVPSNEIVVLQSAARSTFAEQKVKRPSQLPTRQLAKKSLIVPKTNWKTNVSKDVYSSADVGPERFAFGQVNNEETKRFNMPGVKSQRIIK